MALLPIMEAKALTASFDHATALSAVLPAGTMSTNEHNMDISGSRRKRGSMERMLKQKYQRHR